MTMFGYLSDFERTFAAMDELRRRLSRGPVAEADAGDVFTSDTAWPRTSVYDTGEALLVVADVPGVRDTDIEISLNPEGARDLLTLAGERKLEVPEGHLVHRQERRSARFSRSFALPYKVDGNALGAELKDGVLTVKLPKAPEAQARKIQVQVR
jgi:HSP20 family protein